MRVLADSIVKTVGLSDENPTQQCARIGRGGDAHDVTEPQSFGNSSDCNLQRHDADNLNGSPDGSAAASESGVEGATSEATHASSPSSLQEQNPEESAFEVTPFVMSLVGDHLDAAVEAVVNEMRLTNKASKFRGGVQPNRQWRAKARGMDWEDKKAVEAAIPKRDAKKGFGQYQTPPHLYRSLLKPEDRYMAVSRWRGMTQRAQKEYLRKMEEVLFWSVLVNEMNWSGENLGN
eukprot:scaffold41701_cov42-Cyclotella_meneghiniana.AAC.1